MRDEIAPRLAQLADYGITQTEFDALEAAIADYSAHLVAPREAITDRKAATAALREGFAAADRVLRERLDKLVPILAADSPAFGVDYRNARIIVNSATRSETEEEEEGEGEGAEPEATGGDGTPIE